MSRNKDYSVILDHNSVSYHNVRATSKKQAIEKAKDEAWGHTPDDELTVYEVEIDQ